MPRFVPKPARALALCTVFTAAALAACASRSRLPPPPPGPPLFVSPAGEPFRGPMGSDPRADWFRGADANGDGAIDLEEFRADFARFFKLLDENGDGRIDAFENVRYETDIVPEILGRESPSSGPGRSVEGTRPAVRGGGGLGGRFSALRGAAPYGLLDIPQPIRAADADFSQAIDMAEFMAAADRRFALIDKTGDGRITAADLPPVRTRAEAGPGGRGGEGVSPPARPPRFADSSARPSP